MHPFEKQTQILGQWPNNLAGEELDLSLFFLLEI